MQVLTQAAFDVLAEGLQVHLWHASPFSIAEDVGASSHLEDGAAERPGIGLPACGVHTCTHKVRQVAAQRRLVGLHCARKLPVVCSTGMMSGRVCIRFPCVNGAT